MRLSQVGLRPALNPELSFGEPVKTAQSTDRFEESCQSKSFPPQGPLQAQSIDRKKQFARYAVDAVQLGVGDAPTVLSLLANGGLLPTSFNPALSILNSLNVFTGVASMAFDFRETLETMHNPKANRTDKIIEVTHLVAGDILPTASALIPLVASMNTPLAQGLFIGGQLLGLSLDVAKTVYDIKRQGQQSVR